MTKGDLDIVVRVNRENFIQAESDRRCQGALGTGCDIDT
jgi:hypothetical protein